MPITTDSLTARIDRLAEVARELHLDAEAYRTDAELPLLYTERVELGEAVGQALDGVERARVALARARMRLREGGSTLEIPKLSEAT